MPYTTIGGIGEVIIDSAAEAHNKCNILTLNNVVMLCDNFTLTDYLALDPILTLSNEDFYPLTDVVIPVFIEVNNTKELVPITLNTNGELTLENSYESAILYLNGCCFHVNSKWYTPEIGNIYDNGTSPLTESLA